MTSSLAPSSSISMMDSLFSSSNVVVHSSRDEVDAAGDDGAAHVSASPSDAFAPVAVPLGSNSSSALGAVSLAKKRPKVEYRLFNPTETDHLKNLKTMVEKTKWKSKEYNHENLRTLMSIYQQWGNEVVPGLHFDDFLRRTFNLGKKQLMQNTLEAEREGKLEFRSVSAKASQSDDNDAENDDNDDDFDNASKTKSDHLWKSLYDQERSLDLDFLAVPNDNARASPPADDNTTDWDVVRELEAERETQQAASSAVKPISLTDEQRERMARNRAEALTKMKARQKRSLDVAALDESSVVTQDPAAAAAAAEPSESASVITQEPDLDQPLEPPPTKKPRTDQ